MYNEFGDKFLTQVKKRKGWMLSNERIQIDEKDLTLV